MNTNVSTLGLKRLAGAALVGCSLAAGTAGAVEVATLPAEHHQGAVSYVSGGVASEEAEAFKQAQQRYPLAIELLEKTGGGAEYTADAMVKLTNAAGVEVLSAKADGPFMLVRLPAGTYRVSATLKGRTVESKPVAIAAKGSSKVALVFPAGTD